MGPKMGSKRPLAKITPPLQKKIPSISRRKQCDFSNVLHLQLHTLSHIDYICICTNSRWQGPRGREPGCSHTHSSPAMPHHEPPRVPQGAGKRQLWQGRSFWKMEDIEKHFSTVFIYFVFRYIKNLHKKKKTFIKSCFV